MKIKVLAFGQAAEIIGDANRDYPYVPDTDDLIKQLADNFPELKNLEYSLAVNKQIVRGNTRLQNEDTVAILPPFSGG